MLNFKWDKTKDDLLIKNRRISFTLIAAAIRNNKVINVIDHPDQLKYKNQKIAYIKIKNYIWMVPFIKSKKTVFLKTAYPSRKATKKYLKK